ncbi:MAG: Fic family protein, partial [Burkholderiales bacterium]
RDYVDALLGVYERTDVSILRDVYEWAYERSCARYKAVRDSMGEPDPFRLKYRRNLAAAVRAVVVERQPVARALESQALAAADRERLHSIVLAELERLHEGSFARFGIRPAEYASWVAAGRVSA